MLSGSSLLLNTYPPSFQVSALGICRTVSNMKHENNGGPLYGWTFHQSHDQATVLFLVPQTTSANDIDIRINTDFVSAGLLNHPPVFKARLYGKVNTESCSWRIASRERSRRRQSRSLARSSPEAPSTSASGSAEAAFNQHVLAGSRDMSGSALTDSASPASPTSSSHHHTESPPASHSSLSASIVSQSSGSSYEMLSHSTPRTLPASSTGYAAEWSSDSSEFGSADSADVSLTQSLTQSLVLSDPGDLRRHGNRAVLQTDPASSELRRTRSIPSFAPATSSAAESTTDAFQTSPNKLGPAEARLVTLHLDKKEGGIWPLLVVGPAPIRTEALPARLTRLLGPELPRNGLVTEAFVRDRLLKRREAKLNSTVEGPLEEGTQREQQQRSAAQLQLNQALEEALSAFEGGDRVLAAIRRGSPQDEHSASFVEEASIDSEDGLGPSTSTISLNTIGSDESATVLGSRIVGLEQAQANALNVARTESQREAEDEILEAWKELEVLARYNMDPTSISLIGLQFANGYGARRASSLTQTAMTSLRSVPEAFEYFVRAWRAADVSLATERLVQDFLPLLPSTPHGASHQDHTLNARLAELFESDLLKCALTLPATGEIIADRLRERFRSHSFMSYRQRIVASLGGMRALARLYLSYARLHLPSYESSPRLAFPYGQLTSPFVSAGHTAQPDRPGKRLGSTSSSSRTSSVASVPLGGAASPSKTRAPNSPTVAESSRAGSPGVPGGHGAHFWMQSDQGTASQPGPFYFLREACLLDSDIVTQISSQEWLEAISLAIESEAHRAAELEGLAQAEEMGSMAGDSESGCLAFESDNESHRPRAKLRGAPSSATSSTGLDDLLNFVGLGDASTSEAGRKRSRKQPRRRDKDKRRKERRVRKTGQGPEEAGVINFVSGAALLGVALAGSVAALGWWRRTSAALNSSA